jgi:DNA-binding NarL/FixJ family response regulator
VVCDAVLFEQSTPLLTAGPAPAVVAVAEATDLALLGPTLRRGARGWVPRDASVADLVVAVREAARGGTWLPPRLLTALLAELLGARPAADPVRTLLDTLTPRERDVLFCLSDGASRAEVGLRLHLSTNTVRTHVQSILSKLGVSSSVAAVALCRPHLRVQDPT